MSYVSNPTDTIVPTTGISFSTLKNTFGPEGSYPVSFSNYMVGVMGNIGQTTSLSSFRGKNLPDPVLNAALAANVNIYGNQYEPLDTSIALNTNFRFNKRFFRRFSVQGVAVTITNSRFDATLVNFIANGVSSSIVAGAATGTSTFDRVTTPISVTVRKRNGIVKTVYSATADATDTLTSMFAKFDVALAKSTLTYSNTHHWYNHVLHHNYGHHKNPGNGGVHGGTDLGILGNTGDIHNNQGGHTHRAQWRHPNTAVGRNPHVPDHRATHTNRPHGQHSNRNHGHHTNHGGSHKNNQSYGNHYHLNHSAGHHNDPSYHHNNPAQHQNHAHHSDHHHYTHSHAYSQSSGSAQILENSSDLPNSVFTLTVTPNTSSAGSCGNQRNLVEVADRFDQVGDYVAGCTSRYTLSVKPNWTSTSYVSGIKEMVL